MWDTMKIAMISDFPSEDIPYGGLQTHVYHLSSSISLLECAELHIVSFADENKDFKKNNLNIHLVKRPMKIPRIFTIPYDTWLIKRKILKINPDIVHVQGTHYPYNVIAGYISKLFPTILTVHGIMAIEYKFNRGLNFIGVFISYLLEKYAFSKVKYVVVCSPIMKDLVVKNSDADIYVIPNGIDINLMRNTKLLEGIKYPSILFIGLLEKIKGLDILLKSVAIVKDKFPQIRLYVAGKGSQEHYLKQLTKKLKIEDNVEFLGYIHGKDKYSYIKSADIFVVPSRYESFGIAILEAMACESSIIASNVGNIPYLLKNDLAGLTFELDNVDELAEKIIFLLKNRNLREKMGKESSQIAKNFEWDRIAEKTFELYETVRRTNNG